MCGIAGIMDLRGRRPVDPDRLARMSALVAHRGPDGSDDFRAAGIGLAHRRLAIIDLEGGRQPLFNETDRVCVVYNGEIYNFQELAAELRAHGHVFRTHCDTEVIVHAWEQWGASCVDRFRGMFAFALWDADREVLFLARDRLGEKPLYYTETDDGLLLVASELRAVVGGMAEVPPLDPEAVEDYFALGYVPDPRTIFRGVHKLPPATRLTVRRGAPPPPPIPYWDVRFAEAAPRDDRTAEEELAARFAECVRMRMIADVPLGAFLSGGVDSSAVVAFMAQASDLPVRTCSMGFPDPRFDESRYAALVAERYGTDHFAETVEIDAFGLIDRLATAYTEPFADSSAVPTFLVSALARKRVTVALSGDGGDELFAGYRRYAFHRREEQVKARLPAGLRRPLFGALARAYPKLDWAPRPLRAKATFEALAADAVGGYFRAVTLLPTPLRRRLYSADFRRALGGYEAIEVLRGHAARSGTDDPVARAQYIDLKTWLPGQMLTKVDRASMANGLEVRPPFLDHELVEWAAALPPEQKIAGMDGKAVLKRLIEPLVPREVLHRPKQGFSLPLARWLREGFEERLRALPDEPLLAGTGLFDRTMVRRLVAEHLGRRRDHARTLWSLLMFEAFLRRPWLDQAVPAVPRPHPAVA